MAALESGEVFVHVARGLRFDGRVLTLVDRWAHAVAASPDGAWRVRGSLALLDAEAQVGGDTVFLVSNPRMTATSLAYDTQAVAGAVPSESGACVLYLDWGPAGEPT